MFNQFGFTGNSRFFQDAGEIINKAWYIISTTLGTIFLTFGSAYAGGFEFLRQWDKACELTECISLVVFNPISSLIVGAFLYGYGMIALYIDQDRQQKQNKELNLKNSELDKKGNDLTNALNRSQEELQEQKYETNKLNIELITIWLKTASKNLELNSTERATIYYKFDGTFSLLARYSKNPEYTEIHRQKFPLNQGVIGKAWQHGCFIEKDCPSFKDNQQYKDYLIKTYSYEEDKIIALTMKSCRYVALAIEDADVNIGVIVFESTELEFLESIDRENKIKEYCRNYQGQLSKFVRDGLKLDRETSIKQKNKSVEDDILKIMENNKI